MSLKIVVAGGTGFIGRALVAALVADGHSCTVLTRSTITPPVGNFPAQVAFASYEQMPSEAEVVINLAGESVAGRWTAEKKAKIESSRVQFTDTLVRWMSTLQQPPTTFLSGSATGFYGDRGDLPLNESSGGDPHRHFLGEVCRKWEDAANRASDLGVRVVLLRTGNVLGEGGGMLGKMVPMFKLSPFIVPFAKTAYLPWISLRDEVGLIRWALAQSDINGPLNLVSPIPTTSLEFHTALGRRLHRTVVGNLPDRILQLGVGEFAEALLGSQKVMPQKALDSGFRFQDPQLDTALGRLNL